MKTCFYLSVAFLVATLTSTACGQDLGIFSGRGIGSVPMGGNSIGSSSNSNLTNSLQDQVPDLPSKKPRWPKILDFSKNDSLLPERKPLSGLFKKPSFDLFKDGPPQIPQMKQMPDLFSRTRTFADLFPKRDPNKPNIFSQMNAKSKDFFSKTTDWAARKNQGLRERSSSTWDNVIKDFKDIEPPQRGSITEPAQPNIRTAESMNKPRIRF